MTQPKATQYPYSYLTWLAGFLAPLALLWLLLRFVPAAMTVMAEIGVSLSPALRFTNTVANWTAVHAAYLAVAWVIVFSVSLALRVRLSSVIDFVAIISLVMCGFVIWSVYGPLRMAAVNVDRWSHRIVGNTPQAAAEASIQELDARVAQAKAAAGRLPVLNQQITELEAELADVGIKLDVEEPDESRAGDTMSGMARLCPTDRAFAGNSDERQTQRRLCDELERLAPIVAETGNYAQRLMLLEELKAETNP